MSFLTGSSEDSWKPAMTGDTTRVNYWFNWRVLLCALWLLMAMAFALALIFKYEGFCRRRSGGSREKSRDDDEEEEEEEAGDLYDDETWSPCLKGIHPVWLLAFRAVAFFVLLVMLIVTSFIDGGSIFYYYTQWTFTLVTVYFGLGSLLSLYGCYEYHHRVSGGKLDDFKVDPEQGTNTASFPGVSGTSNNVKSSISNKHARKKADLWGYIFQIIFQMNAGAVVLTDGVFWFIIVPFLTINNYNLSFLDINMHTINVVLLIGDTSLNCLRFPLFRIGYFFMWTIIYVIFQWLLHACIAIWWPYPFLDLSSPFAPLWYFSVALMHFPCYAIFALFVKLKHFLLSRWFPQSYQCAR